MSGERIGRISMVIAVVAVAVALSISVAGPIVGARMIAVAPNAGVRVDPVTDPAPDELAALGVTRQLRVPVGPPDASLLVWVVDPPGGRAPAGTALALHGIRDRKRSMLGIGRALAERGWRAVLPDLRGHGGSSGDWLTFGVVDAVDLGKVLDATAAPGPCGAVGISYGGATAIQLAARDARVGAVVSVAAFSSLREVVPSYVNVMFGSAARLIPPALVASAVNRAGSIGGFDPDAASPKAALKRTRAPLLIVHGEADRHIPVAHAEALRVAAIGPVELVQVPGKDHATITGADVDIAGRSAAWFERWLRGGGEARR